jgi:UDP-N-acetylmuramoyl-L-alanyl-D-glutamate--2,6-diaminopimelate ligase
VSGRVTVVFGCGGDRDSGKRPQMGEVAAVGAERIVLTDDNPRGEDPAGIVAGIRAGIPADKPVTVIHDRLEAIEAALVEAGPGDAVLVAGKGHETVQVVGNERRRYSDRETVRRLLGGSPW